MLKAKLVPDEKVELEGPYECPHCGGHFKVDATFLIQVEPYVTCMYCKQEIEIPEEEEEEENLCTCGEVKRNFMHNCSGTSDHPEVYGCPVCDDECGFCKEE